MNKGSSLRIALVAGFVLLSACKRPAGEDAASELARIDNAMNAALAEPENVAEAPPDPQAMAASRVLPAIEGYVPRQLAPLPDGRVALIGTVEKEHAAHVETGWLAIHYLRRAGDGYTLAGSWPREAAGNGFGGAPSSWRTTDRLADNPTVESEAGYGNQGSFCTWITLTELAPGGPVTSKIVLSGYDDSGFHGDSAPATTLTGIITNIVKNRSFDVAFSGTRRFTDHYIRQNGKWVLQGRESGLKECLG